MRPARYHTAALAAAVTLALVAPGPAFAFKGKRGTHVNPVNDAVFEVISRGAGNGGDFWCGAADYAHRALKAPWKATLYIARGRGAAVTANSRSAVHFTLDPAAAGISPAAPSLSINALKIGDNMSVQQANTYCTIPISRF